MELVIDRLTKNYKNKIAVDRFTTSFGKGVYGLLGANGAGKTTLMRLICGILRPTSGEVLCDGSAITALGEGWRERLGYLPQSFGYYPNFTANDFMLYMASLKGIEKEEAKRRSDELLETVSLGAEKKQRIKTFSGGMKQRLGIAQAMLNDPDVLILDEPTAGLDPKERVKFRNLISALSADKIVLLSTHIVSDVELIANEILVMKAGQLMHRGTIDRLLSEIEGKVWSFDIPTEEIAGFEERLNVINVAINGREAKLRAVCDGRPREDAVPETARLEDLYLYYFGNNNVETGKDD